MITNYLALDIGRARIGLALANNIARIASPLTFINNDEQVVESLGTIIREHDVQQLVVGLPRGLNGQETEQTEYVTDFCKQLEITGLPIALQDEAVTSVKAEQELAARGEPYEKGDIDSLSAVYILEDYLAEGVN